MDELLGGEVDRNAQRRPAHRLSASGSQDPFGQRQDQAAAFGDRDELGWRHVAPVGVVPPQERLDADDALRGEIDLGLIGEAELFLAQRLAEIDLQRFALV